MADVITVLTFGDLELVVLLVPKAASLVVDDPHRKLCVRTVRRFQGEIRCCSRKKKENKGSNLLIKHLNAPLSTFFTSTRSDGRRRAGEARTMTNILL